MVFVICTLTTIWEYSSTRNNYETFDVLIKTADINDCANKCSTTYGCWGFTFDDKDQNNKKCYLSKTPISGMPVDSIYSEDFSLGQKTCNKILTIRNEYDIESSRLKLNKLYSCYDNYIGIENLIYYDNETTITNPSDSDLKKINVKNYNLNYINWPITKKENDKMFFESKNNEIDYRYITFVEHDDEYLGKYLYNHQCTTEINKFDCLRSCANDNKCHGTEWNPELKINDKKYHNVCCPKKTIYKVVKRYEDNKNGKYYEKKYKNKLETNLVIVN
jgi:hypothetical protein